MTAGAVLVPRIPLQVHGLNIVLAVPAQFIVVPGAQLEAFPAELEAAVATAREQAWQTASAEAQVETDLFAKEIAANQQVRELHIQSLEETIVRQNEQLEALAAELKETLKQAQTLAFRAISGATAETPLSE